MIILNSRNQVLIRVPKTASTSLAVQVYDNFLDPVIDVSYTIEDNTVGEFVEDSYRREVNFKPIEHLFKDHMDAMHASWWDLKELNLVDDSMEILTTIRHPIDRWLSIYYFHKKYFDPKLPPVEEVALQWPYDMGKYNKWFHRTQTDFVDPYRTTYVNPKNLDYFFKVNPFRDRKTVLSANATKHLLDYYIIDYNHYVSASTV